MEEGRRRKAISPQQPSVWLCRRLHAFLSQLIEQLQSDTFLVCIF